MSIERLRLCPICGLNTEEYHEKMSCRKYHNWQKSWRVDKTSEKYKQYLNKRKISMETAARRRLEALDKSTPAIYKSRHKCN